MKNLVIQIGLILLVLLFAGLTFNQCSRKKSAQDETLLALQGQKEALTNYLELIKAKTRIDTVYKAGKTNVIHKTDFKTITDTLYVENGKVYGVFKDSIRTAELTLTAKITASDLKAIDYVYSVREKIIREQSIVYHTDTLIQAVRRGQLIGLADVGLHSYSAGLQYQSRKRIGFTARYNLFQDEKYISVGIAYRIF